MLTSISNGDLFELRFLILVAAAGFVMPGPRWRYFATFGLLLVNHVTARLALAFADDPVIWACAAQVILALILLRWHETWVGQWVGILFGVSVFSGALAYDGQLALAPSDGLAMNYWSAMSVASFLQNCLLLFVAGARTLRGRAGQEV
jgi:hypothetical protein